MSGKRATRDKLAASTKRSRKSINLAIKLEILKRFETGEKAINIARAFDLPSSSVRTIRVNAGRIQDCAQSSAPLSTTKITRTRDGIMENMERLLNLWIQDQNKRNSVVGMTLIQEKAKRIFDELKKSYEDRTEVTSFCASRGWFERFKKRSNLCNIRSTDDGIHVDSEEKGGYHQIFQEIESENNVAEQAADEVIPNENSSERKQVGEKVPPRKITLKKLTEAFDHLEAAMSIFRENDPNEERSLTVISALTNDINCYKELYEQRKRKNRRYKHRSESPEVSHKDAEVPLSTIPVMAVMETSSSSEEDSNDSVPLSQRFGD